MGSSKKQTVGYRYYMGLHMGLTHGPVDALLEIRAGDRTAWSGNQTASGTITINAPDLFGGDDREGGVSGLLDVMMGEPAQVANSYLASIQGTPQPAYRGMFGVVFRGPSATTRVPAPSGIGGIAGWLSLLAGRPSGLVASNNPYIKPWAFRIRRILQGWTGAVWYSAKASIDLGAGVIAMNPAHIVYECMTNAEWGLGYPSGQLDLPSFTAAADIFHAEGLGLCLAWQQQDAIESFIQVVMDHAGAVLVQDQVTGLFKLKAIRGDYTLGSLPLFGSQTGNVLEVGRIERATYTEAVNEITVAYTDAATGKDGSVTVQNLAAIQAQGVVSPETRQYPGLPTAELALRTAMRDLQAATSALARVTLTVNRAAYNVLPGDVIRFEWLPAGISEMALRVGSVDYGSLTDGTMTLECVEDVFGLPSTSYVDNQPPLWIAPDYTPQASPVVAAFEAPYRELVQVLGRDDAQAVTITDGFFGIVAVRPPGLSSYYLLETRTASTSFAETAQQDWCPSTTLSATVTPVQTVLSISSTADLGLVSPGSLAMIGTGATAEFVRVDSADSVAGTITVGRGCLDTVPRQWSGATPVLFLDEFTATDGKEYAAGEVVTGRIRTRAGSGILADTSSPTASVTIAGRAARPYPPGNFRLNGNAYPASITGALTVSWAHRDRLLQEDQLLDTTAANVGPEASTTYTLRLYDENGTLRRTEAGLTGTSYAWSTEAADSGLAGALASTYWRILVTANDGATDFALNVAEMQLRATAGGANIATGGTAISSAAFAGNPASNAFDGNASTMFNSADTSFPAHLGYQLPTAQLVGAVWIRAGDNAARALRAPRTFQIQYSSDGTNWTTAVTVANSSGWGAGEAREFTVPASGRLNNSVRAELWAVRGGVESHQRHDITVPRV